jgi:hypothetical protein
MGKEVRTAILKFDTAAQSEGYSVRTTYGTWITLTTFAANATNEFEITAHKLATGDGPFRLTGGDLPAGLSTNTDYWIIRVDADGFSLATSPENAAAGTAVAMGDDGSGAQVLVGLPVLKGPIWIDHIAIFTGNADTAFIVTDRVTDGSDIFNLDAADLTADDAIWWDIKDFVKGIYINTIPTNGKIYVHLGKPGGN